MPAPKKQYVHRYLDIIQKVTQHHRPQARRVFHDDRTFDDHLCFHIINHIDRWFMIYDQICFFLVEIARISLLGSNNELITWSICYHSTISKCMYKTTSYDITDHICYIFYNLHSFALNKLSNLKNMSSNDHLKQVEDHWWYFCRNMCLKLVPPQIAVLGWAAKILAHLAWTIYWDIALNDFWCLDQNAHSLDDYSVFKIIFSSKSQFCW